MSTHVLLAMAVVAAPFAGAALLAAGRPRRAESGPGILALAVAAICAALVAWLWAGVPRPLSWHTEWIGAAGLDLGLYVDDLALLFAVLVAGVSLLSLLYSLRYIPHEMKREGSASSQTTYYAYMLLFTGAMLGMVFASDLVQLYVFWELTSVASFLLIGLDWRNSRARHGAVKALLVTSLGGMALLVSFILLGSVAGTFFLPAVLDSGEQLHASPVFGLALLLLLAGAAAKSAQFPFHVWLPDAMVAPTPVSAFLHSAALVAAGVYLLARFHPLFASAPLWQWSVTSVGFASVLVGGVLALKAKDLKTLLAYSTISQYGFVFALLGYATAGAVTAALFNFLQHGLVKAGLFFAAGIITYATGQRELGLAGGLWRRLLFTFLASAALALSLGGLPPLAGFWMKESFLGVTLTTQSLGLVVLALAGAALTLTYMLRFLGGAFVAGQAGPAHVVSPPALMLIAPAILALLTVLFGLRPDLAMTTLVGPAATAVLGRAVPLDLAPHFNVALLLSLLALGLGAGAFATYRQWGFLIHSAARPEWSLDRLYAGSASSLDRAGRAALSLHNGVLLRYIHFALLGLLGLIGFSAFFLLPSPPLPSYLGGAIPTHRGFIDVGMALLLALIAVGTVLTFVVRRHVHVVLALSTVGYLIAGVFALELAPDVGLVQVHVETLVTVLFLLALVLVPRPVRRRVVLGARERLTSWNMTLAALGGIGSAWISWLAIEYTPADPIAPWFNENALELTHAGDVVAAILVDFRALDTLGEITVFAIAMLGVYALARLIKGETE